MATDEELAKIDKEIQRSISVIINKPASQETWAPAKYGQLIDEVRMLPHYDRRQAVLADQFSVLRNCFERGVNEYLTKRPIAMCELLAISQRGDTPLIGNANYTYIMREQRKTPGKRNLFQPLDDELPPMRKVYPDLHAPMRTLLAEFTNDWYSQVVPDLATRIFTYGREKLVAEGIQKTLQDWVDINRDGFLRLGWPTNHYDRHLIQKPFVELVELLAELNTNDACEKVFHELLRDLKQRGRPKHLHKHLEQLSECFATTADRVTPERMQALRTVISEMDYSIDHLSDSKTFQPIHELRNIYHQYVEVPYYDAPRVLRQNELARYRTDEPGASR